MQKVATLRCRGLSVSQAAPVHERPSGVFVEIKGPLPVGSRVTVQSGETVSEARVAEVIEQDPSGKAVTGMLLAWIGQPIAADAFPEATAAKPPAPPVPEPAPLPTAEPVTATLPVAAPPFAEPPVAAAPTPELAPAAAGPVAPAPEPEPQIAAAPAPEVAAPLAPTPEAAAPLAPTPEAAAPLAPTPEAAAPLAPTPPREIVHHRPPAVIVETPEPAPPPSVHQKPAALIVEDAPELFSAAPIRIRLEPNTPLVIGGLHEAAEPTIRTEMALIIDSASPAAADDDATIQMSRDGAAPAAPMDESGEGSQTTRFVIGKEEKKGKKNKRRR